MHFKSYRDKRFVILSYIRYEDVIKIKNDDEIYEEKMKNYNHEALDTFPVI